MAVTKMRPRVTEEREKAWKPMRLEIVVSPHCRTCRLARWTALDVQERFPNLTVDLIELDGRHPTPSQVVATPTYLLDGAVIALGNPDRQVIEREIVRRQAERR